ncbi:tetratricopeptide repeat protein [Chitinophagaceae bacterium LWZ2-11]
MKVRYLLLALLIVFTWAAYSNHFKNGFHFDDSHTIENNIYIRNIKNVPLFFKDGTTFSSLPSNQSYRPIVSTSLAIDYWMGNGLNPFYFHLSTFIIFLLQGVILFFFFLKIFDVVYKNGWNIYISFAGAAWYLLHPANAETVNYIIARSDVQSTFFVMVAFWLYLYSPFCKKYFIYLLPAAIGILAKPSAVMFAPLFFFYVLLFEEKMSIFDFFKKVRLKQSVNTIKKSIPSFVICIAFYLWMDKMTPKTWIAGGTSAFQYLITQPFVIVHYFGTWFLPTGLSADSDWSLIPSIWDARFFAGCLFIIALLALAFYCSKKEILRPISYGIIWFFLALIPSSSIIPLAEVLNDHRIFFPFIGLALSVCWALGLLLMKYKPLIEGASSKFKSGLAIVVVLVLGCYAYGVYERNKVWNTEESLWYDVTIKSPLNARGLMNYGLTKMAKSEYAEAEKYFDRALELAPNYTNLYINKAIVKDVQGDKITAEADFKKGLELAPNYPAAWFYYARFLNAQGRYSEAVPLLEKAIALSPAYIDARLLLLACYSSTSNWDKLSALVESSLQIEPDNKAVQAYITIAKNRKNNLDIAADNTAKDPTPEKYLNLSLTYYNAGRYQDCINAAEQALKLKPDYADAYNNIGTAYNMLKQYDKAAEACKKALALNPQFTLAKNNLAVAEAGKKQQPITTTTGTPEAYITLSLEYYNKGMYVECIEACKKALQLKPDYALAYNNICASYNQLKQWDNAIAAGEKGIKLDPQNTLMKGNLAAAYAGKK